MFAFRGAKGHESARAWISAQGLEFCSTLFLLPRALSCGFAQVSIPTAVKAPTMRYPTLRQLIGPNLTSIVVLLLCGPLLAQPATWDSYFEHAVERLEADTKAELAAVTPDNWDDLQAQWRSELFEMLGLAPLPARTDLQTTVTGSIHHHGLTVERLHYQSRPGLYVAANLYLPEGEPPAAGWPAVLYVCGHANVTDAGRKLGNKTAYQHHGLWFARHGVACLIIDTVQLGELHGEHHGTYKLGRWDWISRGYTPAGVEAWNAIRGIDLLESWPGINSSRIGITGRSGGGVYSWFAAALDERIKVAVPVAGITDLRNHVVDGCVEGHCDCMYFVNYFGWDYPKLAALIAPRPLLLANSDSDGIFPLDGVMRTHRQLSQLYAALGASENYGVLITPGPHKDTQELQVGAFRWLLRTLTGETPIVSDAALKELTAEELAVFTRETPADERVAAVGSWFVPTPATESDPQRAAEQFRQRWLPQLSRTALALAIESQAAAPQFEVTPLGPINPEQRSNDQTSRQIKLHRADVGDGLAISVLEIEPSSVKDAPSEKQPSAQSPHDSLVHIGLLDQIADDSAALLAFARNETTATLLAQHPAATHYFIRSRGADWQQAGLSVKKQNQIVRRFYLLGQTPEQRQVADVLSSLRLIKRLVRRDDQQPPKITLVGANRSAAIATLAGLLCAVKLNPELPSVAELRVSNYPTDPELAPALPGILRVCDYASLLAAARGSIPSVVIDSAAETRTDKPTNLQRLVDSSSEPQQANGLRIVEVSQNSAKVWVRATRWLLPNLGDLPDVKFANDASGEQTKRKTQTGPILPESGVEGLQYAVPGVGAEVRVGHRSGSGDWQYSPWLVVTADTDYSAIFTLDQLPPGQAVALRTQTRAPGQAQPSSTLSGEFTTLPAKDAQTTFRLAVGTCQAFPDRDGPHGFDLYRTISKRDSDAFVMAGDVVYYDKLGRSVPLAYYHWQRTYSLPTLIDFHSQVPTYFLKDDHDTYVDDSWPGQRHAWTEDFTFEDGQRIFIQETGLPSPAYRSFQIGSDLQIWLMEGRDHRSPNTAPDGPDKSIWAAEQKAWLKQTLDASTAKFKVVISPTPLVGPDRDNKRDNHANAAFQFEGDQVRQLLASYPNTVSVCGDRHWQYHSIDPVSGLHEFSVGPASDRHAGGWQQSDYRQEVHQFLRVAGGYLEIELSGEPTARSLVLRHLDTHGNEHHSHTLR